MMTAILTIEESLNFKIKFETKKKGNRKAFEDGRIL